LKTSGYNIDLESAAETINKNNYKQVVLQIPEGLKNHALKFVEFLEKETRANFIISADPCFGACDLVNYEYKNLDVDFAVQIGHTPIPDIQNFGIPTLFINAESNLDVTKVINKAIPHLKVKKIGLTTTTQHIHSLNKVREILEENNFKPITGEGDNRIELKGQILGCNFSSAKSIASMVDLFLYIGSGNFHPLGLLLSTKKPVIIADPYTNQIRDTELNELKDNILRQRYGAIARSKEAKTFGILVGIKRGQQRINTSFEIKELLESKQKKSYIIALDHFSSSNLENFRNIDCFVSTACPRIAIDDYMQYKIPIITPIELEILLGKKKWEDYQFDEIIYQ
jgi:2-(3-amino-3-carboxypropyl)histidine synthase